MKALLTITTTLLLGTTAISFAQTPSQMQSQQGLSPSQTIVNQNRINARRPATTLERDTTGMGLREPEAEFLFSPGAKDPQRNDPTVSPFGPMNNID